MSEMPKVGELAPDFELRDDEGRRTASPTAAATSRSSTSTRPTTRRAAPRRPARSATTTPPSRTPTPRSGASARRDRPARRPSGPSTACRSRFSPTRTMPSPSATAAWAEKMNYGKTYWGSRPVELPGRPGRANRPRLAEGQAGRPRQRGPGGRARGPLDPACLDARATAAPRYSRAEREASPVGGDERSLARHDNSAKVVAGRHGFSRPHEGPARFRCDLTTKFPQGRSRRAR